MVKNALPAGDVRLVITVSRRIYISHHPFCRLGIHLEILHAVFQSCLIRGVDIHIQVIRNVLQNIVRTASHYDAGTLRCEIPDNIFLRIEDFILQAGHSHPQRILSAEKSGLHALFLIADDRYRKSHTFRRSFYNISVQKFDSKYIRKFPGNGSAHTSKLS